jgi:hypothetical protein
MKLTIPSSTAIALLPTIFSLTPLITRNPFMENDQKSNALMSKQQPRVTLCSTGEEPCKTYDILPLSPCTNIINTTLSNTIMSLDFNREFSGCHFHEKSDCESREWIKIYGTLLEPGKFFDFNAPGSNHPGGLGKVNSFACFGPPN